MKILIVLTYLFVGFWGPLYAEDKGKKIIYLYKKHEKFDFEDLNVEGDVDGPGDLSIFSRFQRRFKNPLPYRKTFNKEIKISVERIK